MPKYPSKYQILVNLFNIRGISEESGHNQPYIPLLSPASGVVSMIGEEKTGCYPLHFPGFLWVIISREGGEKTHETGCKDKNSLDKMRLREF